MTLEIPNFNIKNLTERLTKSGFKEITTNDFFLMAAYLKQKTDTSNSWATIYSSKLETITPHYVELITLMVQWELIEVRSYTSKVKIEVSLKPDYKNTTRIIKINERRSKIPYRKGRI